jgi:hypothetical protein
LKTYLLLIITTSLLAFASCEKQQDRSSEQDSVLDKAMTMIESGKTDDAIDALQIELKKDPKSDKTREILASAYASRAGIHVENYYGFTFSYDALIKGPQDFQTHTSDQDPIDLSKVFTGLPPEAINALQNFSANLYIIQSIHHRLEQIPLVNDTQIQDLMRAIEILKPTALPGAHMYRLILEIIVLRASLEQDGHLLQTAAEKGISCQSNFDTAMQSVQFSFTLIQDMLSDIMVGYPSKADDLRSTQKQLSDVLGDLPDKAQKTRLLLCSGS